MKTLELSELNLKQPPDMVYWELLRKTKEYISVKKRMDKHKGQFFGWSNGYRDLFISYCINPPVRCTTTMEEDFKRKKKLIGL